MGNLIQIKSIVGELLFEYECENNTIKKTVEKAIKEKVNLSYADLGFADLGGADLGGADLGGVKNIETANIPMFCKWQTSILGDKIQIGCRVKTIQEWDLFFQSSEEFETKRNTEEFKQIQAVFEGYKSYINFLNN